MVNTVELPKNTFFDIGIHVFDSKTIVDEILNCVSKGKKTIFLGLNADCFNISRTNNQYRQILQNDDYYIYPDGISIVWAHKFLNNVSQARIVTTDLILYLLSRLLLENSNVTITFLGGIGGISRRAKDQLNEMYAIDSIRHAIEPSFISLEEVNDPGSNKLSALIKYLNDNPTDILFVGLGCPKQEILCNNILHRIPQKILFPCGGLFSYYANKHKRAPLRIQKMGLEWFFRFMLEPKRLWKRYLVGNLIFAYHIINKKLSI